MLNRCTAVMSLVLNCVLYGHHVGTVASLEAADRLEQGLLQDFSALGRLLTAVLLRDRDETDADFHVQPATYYTLDSLCLLLQLDGVDVAAMQHEARDKPEPTGSAVADATCKARADHMAATAARVARSRGDPASLICLLSEYAQEAQEGTSSRASHAAASYAASSADRDAPESSPTAAVQPESVVVAATGQGVHGAAPVAVSAPVEGEAAAVAWLREIAAVESAVECVDASTAAAVVSAAAVAVSVEAAAEVVQQPVPDAAAASPQGEAAAAHDARAAADHPEAADNAAAAHEAGAAADNEARAAGDNPKAADNAAAEDEAGAAEQQRARVSARQSVLAVLKGRHGLYAIQNLAIGEWSDATQGRALRLLATLLVASPEWAHTVRSPCIGWNSGSSDGMPVSHRVRHTVCGTPSGDSNQCTIHVSCAQAGSCLEPQLVHD